MQARAPLRRRLQRQPRRPHPAPGRALLRAPRSACRCRVACSHVSSLCAPRALLLTSKHQHLCGNTMRTLRPHVRCKSRMNLASAILFRLSHSCFSSGLQWVSNRAPLVDSVGLHKKGHRDQFVDAMLGSPIVSQTRQACIAQALLHVCRCGCLTARGWRGALTPRRPSATSREYGL